MAVMITGSALAFGSSGTVAALTVPLGTAPLYAARAWVNFSGSTGTILSSGNVSSITDNGVGDYTVNFTTSMYDVNYVAAGVGSRETAAAGGIITPGLVTAAAYRFTVRDVGNVARDGSVNTLAFFR